MDPILGELKITVQQGEMKLILMNGHAYLEAMVFKWHLILIIQNDFLLNFKEEELE